MISATNDKPVVLCFRNARIERRCFSIRNLPLRSYMDAASDRAGTIYDLLGCLPKISSNIFRMMQLATSSAMTSVLAAK